MAFTQFQEAVGLVRELNKVYEEKQQPNKTSEEKQEPGVTCRHQKYNLGYGFYAVMGGFVTDDVRDIDNTLERVTISARGVAFLAKQGSFLDISRETILAKSKAGLVGKALIVTQVAMCLLN